MVPEDAPLRRNQDLEDTPPSGWVQLRERVRRADAVLFATSEETRVAPTD